MIRHFFYLTFALPVRRLPGRVKPRAPQRPLIIGPVTPPRLLPCQL
jgi:hypothetical protein